jgi:hypothetical protein
MATVWIFFGSGAATGVFEGIAMAGGTGAAFVAGAAAAAAAAGPTGAGKPGVPDAKTPGGGVVGAGKTGIVETTRGAALTGAGTSTGFSWRGTSFSPEPALPASAWSDVPARELPALGKILLGLLSALMIGGNDGSIELPNIAR